MPIIKSEYKPPHFFKNSYFSTIYSGRIRKVNDISQVRERLTLEDGDFMDLDFSFAKQKTNKLIIILHGLEGNAQRHYMLGTAKLLNENNIDAVCVNFRGCGGEDNLKYRSYHSGNTQDLKEVIQHVLENRSYDTIYLNGYSLGANVILKYLGETEVIPNEIKGSVAVSVPCFLNSSLIELMKPKNMIYARIFQKKLVAKLKIKQEKFPNQISKETINNISSLKDFDDVYTSKAHGFIDAEDYYTKTSSLQYLQNIKIPTLIINALNDSFLSPECFPVKEAKENDNLFLEMPEYGGHVGFYKKGEYYYNELKTLEFFKKHF